MERKMSLRVFTVSMSTIITLTMMYIGFLYFKYQPIHNEWEKNFGSMTPAEFWNIGERNVR